MWAGTAEGAGGARSWTSLLLYGYLLPERPLLCYTSPRPSVKGPLVTDKGSVAA